MHFIQIESRNKFHKKKTNNTVDNAENLARCRRINKEKTEKSKEKPPVRRSMAEERWFWLWRVCWALKSKSLITEESIEDKPLASTSELCRRWSSPSEPWELEGSVVSSTTLSFSAASIVVWFSSVRRRKWCCDWEKSFMSLTTKLNGMLSESVLLFFDKMFIYSIKNMIE